MSFVLLSFCFCFFFNFLFCCCACVIFNCCRVTLFFIQNVNKKRYRTYHHIIKSKHMRMFVCKYSEFRIQNYVFEY